MELSCTSCHTLLSIDDAFAGGVCRCQHCGTIQTVPPLARAPGAPGPTPRQPPRAPKALYQTPSRSTGSGLEDLAQALARNAPRRPPKKPPARLLPLLLAALALLALASVALWLALP